jgi:hypothetical protein
MIRVAILLIGIGIGFGVARFLVPAPKAPQAETAACNAAPAAVACTTTGEPVASPTAPSASAPVAASSPAEEPVPHVTVTIPDGGYGNGGPAVGALPTEDPSVADVFSTLGLRKGDVILRINEQQIYSPLEALTLLQALSKVNAPVKEVLVRRGGREIKITPPRS